MPVIDDIFDTLKNGHWHNLEEISQKTHLNELKLELIANFLSEYNFIEIDKKENKTRLSPPLLIFLKRIQSLERKQNS